MPRPNSGLIFGCLTLLAAAMAPAQNPQSDGKPGSISGTATNSVTGEPVLRAHISLRAIVNGSTANQQAYGALSDGAGKFSIAQLPPGEYFLRVERVGFVMASSTGATRPDIVSLKTGEEKENIRVTLTPVGSLSGRVLDADGEPVALARVRVQAGDADGWATTDLKGQFRIGGLKPGKYRVKASVESEPLPPEIRQDNTPEKHYAPTYYPNVLEEKAAARVEVQPATESRGIDIRLVRTPIVSVSGKVTGIPPGGNVVLRVSHYVTESEEDEEEREVNTGGDFQLWRLEPGKYTLVAAIDGPASTFRSAPLEIQVTTGNLENLELRMMPPFALSGHLQFDDAPARQPQQPGGDRREITFAGEGDSARAVVGENDAFSLENVQPGMYHVQLFWRGGYVKSVRSGDTESEGDVVDLRNGPPGPLTITIGYATGEISGTVSDSKGPVAGTQIALISAGGRLAESTATGPDGKYFLGEIPPGKYKLAALDEQAFSEANRSRVLEDPDGAEALELHAGDKITKDLKIAQPTR